MENAGEAVVQDGEDEEGVVQQGQHHLDYYHYYCVTQLKLYTFEKLSSPLFCCLSVMVVFKLVHFLQYFGEWVKIDPLFK